MTDLSHYQHAAPRRFRLERDVDTTNVSGTGHVADGIRWRDGTASVIWLTERPSIVFWYRPEHGMTDAEWVHTHAGGTDTRIVWDDPDHSTAYGRLQAAGDVASRDAGRAALRTLGAIARAVRGHDEPLAREIRRLLEEAVTGDTPSAP